MEYNVNGHTLRYHSDGEVARGSNTILLDSAVDLTRNTPWAGKGFGIENLFNQDDYVSFKKRTFELLLSCWRRAGLTLSENFKLENYHHLANDRGTHLKAVEETKLLQIDQFPIAIKTLEQRISAICQTPLIARNPFDEQRIFHFRVVRPLSTDNNPLHRDVWLEDYDDCINLYIPVAGSNENSSLILMEGSHRWAESRVEKTISGALINGAKYNVPAVTKIFGDYKAVRPSPSENQVLVFSPYLIHGGSVNLNRDETRISIEMRLWKK
ncbi:MAG TPA: hypothetical protein VGD40_20955 [Chryseosolibacter sp.]